MIRLSHSSADRFSLCPYAYEREKLIKDVPYTETEATSWGTRCHDYLERFVKGEEVNFSELMFDDLVPTLTYLRDFPADYKQAETEFAFNTSGQVCEFNSPDAMFGGYIDFEAVRGDQGWVCDYKSGKRHSKFEQVELYALSLWLRFPQVNQINVMYMWLKDRTPSTLLTCKTLYRATDMQRIWQYRVDQYERIKAAHITGTFQAKPGKGRATFPCGYCSAQKSVSGCSFSNVEYLAK
jgi:hypothetical protein